MATEVTIGGNGELFADEDKTFLLQVPETDIAGWTIVFDVRDKDNSPTALLLKSATVTGVWNADKTQSTQRAVVAVSSEEMHQFKGSNLPDGAKTYRHSWKRTTTNQETVLSRGDFLPEKATAD